MQNLDGTFMVITRSAPVRRRICCAALALLIPPLGIAVRANARHLPEFLAFYAPDTLWAIMVYVVVVCLAPRLSAKQVALLALGFACLVECSQLYQAPWINELRATKVGGLLLGFGFLWSDLVCYTAGIAIGVVLDSLLSQSPSGSCGMINAKLNQ